MSQRSLFSMSLMGFIGFSLVSCQSERDEHQRVTKEDAKQALQGGKSDTGDKPVADATTHTGGATEAVDTGGHAATEEIFVPTEKSDGGIPNVAADANTTDANDLRAAELDCRKTEGCKRYGKCTRTTEHAF